MAHQLKADRSKLPIPGPGKSFHFPPVDKATLANGLRVWSVRQPQIPVISYVLLIKRGASADPHGKDGLAAITADMLDEGSGDRSAIEMHESLARLGAQFDTDIGADAIAISVTALSRVAAGALAFMGDVTVRPALREADFDRVRQLRLHRLKQMRDSPAAVADRAFLKLLYADDPYGHAPIGHETTLTALTVDDVRKFHAAALTPDAATLIAVGDCVHSELVAQAADVFGAWQSGSGAAAVPAPAPAAPPRLAIVPRAKAPQSELRIGHVAVPRGTPDYHALALANAVLGGQFVSRINLNLREDKGFTYGARTSFEFRVRPGPFLLQVSVQTAATAQAIEESIREISDLRGPRPVTPQELGFGIAALTRGYARNFETADQIARAVMQLALYDLPDDYYEQFVPTVEAITEDDVSRVMTRHVEPSRLTTLVVGDLDVVGTGLARLGLGDPLVLSAEAL